MQHCIFSLPYSYCTVIFYFIFEETILCNDLGIIISRIEDLDSLDILFSEINYLSKKHNCLAFIYFYTVMIQKLMFIPGYLEF